MQSTLFECKRRIHSGNDDIDPSTFIVLANVAWVSPNGWVSFVGSTGILIGKEDVPVLMEALENWHAHER